MLHSVTTRHPDGLAVDWIGRNLYWSDNLLNTIEVSRLDGRHRKVLLRNVSEPRSLQLHPARGYLYYTDWGQDAHVGRVGMDGSASRRIITEGIGKTAMQVMLFTCPNTAFIVVCARGIKLLVIIVAQTFYDQTMHGRICILAS